MGIVNVTFQAANQDELMNDIRQFCGRDLPAPETDVTQMVGGDVPEVEVVEPDPPKPKAKKKAAKKKKAAPEPDPEPKPTEELDLTGEEEAELPDASQEDVTDALRKLMAEKGNGVAAQIMEQFGGSVKMTEIPAENYPLLYSEIMKELDA